MINRIIDVPFHFTFSFKMAGLTKVVTSFAPWDTREEAERDAPLYVVQRSRFLFEVYRYLQLDWIVGYSRPLWLIWTLLTPYHFSAPLQGHYSVCDSELLPPKISRFLRKKF